MKNPWELYESHKDFAKATCAIEKAWEQAKRLAPDQASVERAYLAEKHVYRVLQQWSAVGAMDTEPVWVLRDRVRHHFGVEGGWL